MKIHKLIAATAALGIMLIGSAQAQQADFSPTMSFELSDTKVNANPEMKIHVEQDSADEEELGHVTLMIPKGFNLPADGDIAGGEELGSGEIVIHAGVDCRPGPEGAIPVGADATLPATLLETDRSDEQSDRGVHAVWTLDITGVTKIVLEVTGSKTAGWKIDGDIPANDNTCPPLFFDLTVNAQSGDGVAILTNAAKPKAYKFGGIFSSTGSPTQVTLIQKIALTK
jgi:hypothetical protein